MREPLPFCKKGAGVRASRVRLQDDSSGAARVAPESAWGERHMTDEVL